MPIPITITLNSIVGTPELFNLYSNIDSYTTAFETGVSASGNVITSSNVPNGTTIVKIKSTGESCPYEITKSIVGLPTNTPTATPLPATATPLPATATPIPCVTSASFEVVSGGQIRYVDCCGVTEYINVSAGPEVINDCIQNGSVYALSATIGTVTYGTTPCTCPATPTPLPATVTPTPTPFETTFSGFVSLVNGPSACSGGEYSNVNITVVGTSLCNLTKVKGLSSTMFGNVYGDMTNNTTFWVSDGTDEREFMRDGSAQTGTAQTACTLCSGAPPTSTPLPPTPTPQTYDVYERCDLTAKYYIYYNSGNLTHITINGACCSRIIQNVDDAYIIDNYSPLPTFFSSFTNVTCSCY